MGNELKIGTWENHEHNKVRSNYESNYPNNGGISSKEWHSCWVYGPYLFRLPIKRRPTRASNREINQKLLTLLEQPSYLTASCGELENRVFPQFFCAPRANQKMSFEVTWVFCKVMREHHNGGDGH